jgi:hypothetical protein
VLVLATVLALAVIGGGAWWLSGLTGQAAGDDPTESAGTTESVSPAASDSPEASTEPSTEPEPSSEASSEAPQAITGEVYWDCPTTRTYCRNQGGEPGIRASADDSTAIGYAAVGTVFELVCYETAELITPRGNEGEEGYWDYHPGKDASDVMVKVALGGGEYGFIPFVWLVIDPADLNSLGGLAEC